MTTKESTNEAIKQKIKSYLSKGDIKEISKKHNVTVYNVNKVLNGVVFNPMILESLVEKAEYAKQVQQRALSL